jgi:hypothetical protein
LSNALGFAFELIFYPFSFLNLNQILLSGFVVDVSPPSIPHAFFPESNIVITIRYDPPSEAIPLIVKVLPLINTSIRFSSKTRTNLITVITFLKLPNDTWI